MSNFRSMEYLAQPFFSCRSTWDVTRVNPAALATFKLKPPFSLTKILTAESCASLRSSPENSVRILTTKVTGSQLFAVRLTTSSTPASASSSQDDATLFITMVPLPATSVPQVFESTFKNEYALNSKLTLHDINFADRKVIMRVDYNVPMKDGKITNDFRIRSTLATIQKILTDGPTVLVLMSHLGRPKEKGYEAKFSLKPVADYLQTLIPKVPVHFAPDCMDASAVISTAKKGEIVLLENLRFYPNEGSKDAKLREEMGKKLASYGQIYVNDAFGTAHRKAASVTEVPRILGLGVSGALLNAEIENFQVILQSPQRPLLAIIGGAKVTDKIKTLRHLMGIVDYLIIGGAMAFPFLKAQGKTVGNSMIEKDKKTGEDVTPIAKGLLDWAAAKSRAQLLLPTDHMVASEFKDEPGTPTPDANVPEGKMSLDIGPNTIGRYEMLISTCKAIVWNGPVGVFEMKNFARGTMSVGMAVAKATKESGAVSVVGGGDTVSAVEKFGLTKKLTHVSTGGGATLELLEGTALPGLVYLSHKVAPKL